MILSKEHLTEKGRSKIKLLKSNMNSLRIIPIFSLPGNQTINCEPRAPAKQEPN